jgi:uncharacterized membrane protein YhaH (DUF805 family)
LKETAVRLLRLFTSTEGRIGRADFWKGALLLVLAMFVLSWIAALSGFSTERTFTQTISVQGEPVREIVGTQWQIQPWATFAIGLILSVPFALLAVKRRHDRNFAGWDIYGFVVLQLLIALLAALSVTGDILFMLGVVHLVWSICLLILLGVLRGTPGPNDFGPDPVGGVRNSASSTRHPAS